MRILIDTNIFLDTLLQREPFNKAAKDFLITAGENKDQLYLCVSSLRDMSYFIHKYAHSNDKTNDILIDIYSRVTKLVGITTDDSIEALYLDGDYEDNLIALTAETNMCDAIVSRDKRFKNFRVVLTPDEYLKYRKQ